MNSTAYYNTNAASYISDTLNADMTAVRDRFLAYIPAGGTILDAGCKVYKSIRYYRYSWKIEPEHGNSCLLKKSGKNKKCFQFLPLLSY